MTDPPPSLAPQPIAEPLAPNMSGDVPGAAPGKALSPAARRALDEAAARRAAAPPLHLAPEIDGAAGPEPTRYGDWERKGVAVDF